MNNCTVAWVHKLYATLLLTPYLHAYLLCVGGLHSIYNMVIYVPGHCYIQSIIT